MSGTINLPKKVTDIVETTANYSLAANNWRSYKTAQKHISGAQQWSGVEFELPFTPRMAVTYIGYLLGKPKPVKSETIEKYFSGLRMMHLEQGYNPPCLRSDLVKHILSGAKKMDVEKELLEGKAERMAVTIPVLRLLKQAIKCKKDWDKKEIRIKRKAKGEP